MSGLVTAARNAGNRSGGGILSPPQAQTGFADRQMLPRVFPEGTSREGGARHCREVPGLDAAFEFVITHSMPVRPAASGYRRYRGFLHSPRTSHGPDLSAVAEERSEGGRRAARVTARQWHVSRCGSTICGRWEFWGGGSRRRSNRMRHLNPRTRSMTSYISRYC